MTHVRKVHYRHVMIPSHITYRESAALLSSNTYLHKNLGVDDDALGIADNVVGHTAFLRVRLP